VSPRATIVVPTRDQASLLEACLASLLADRSSVEREVIVVDNGSSDGTSDVVARLAADAPFPVRVIAEPQLGSSQARNAGVRAAGGEALLFVDDDVTVEDGWADALVRGLDDPSVGLVGGRIFPAWPEPPPPWLENGPHKGVLALADFGPQDRLLVDPAERPYSANMALRASVARELDPPFALDLGHHGGRRFGYEDFNLVDRVRAGHGIAYAAGAVAHHRVDPRRMTLAWLRCTFFDMGIGLARSERSSGVRYPLLPQRAARAFRTFRTTQALKGANDGAERTGPETWEELYAYMWTGKHVETLLGRFPRTRDFVRARLV